MPRILHRNTKKELPVIPYNDKAVLFYEALKIMLLFKLSPNLCQNNTSPSRSLPEPRL